MNYPTKMSYWLFFFNHLGQLKVQMYFRQHICWKSVCIKYIICVCVCHRLGMILIKHTWPYASKLQLFRFRSSTRRPKIHRDAISQNSASRNPSAGQHESRSSLTSSRCLIIPLTACPEGAVHATASDWTICAYTLKPGMMGYKMWSVIWCPKWEPCARNKEEVHDTSSSNTDKHRSVDFKISKQEL